MDLPRPPNVLVVDDDVRTTRLLVRLLREDGFDAELVTDGARAIGRLAREPRPDVMITDLWLAHADGAAVMRFARSLAVALPIVVVTPDVREAEKLARGFSPPLRVLAKPVVFEELERELRAATLGAHVG